MSAQYLFESQRAPLTPRLGEVISALARKLGGKQELAAYGVVTALSVATNLRKVRVRANGDRWQPPILMPMVVAPSGSGKSPALWTALKPLLDHEAQRAPKFTEATQRYFAELALWEREKKRLQKEAAKARLKSFIPSATASAPAPEPVAAEGVRHANQ